MKLQEIVTFLDTYLEIQNSSDAAWNGLQFEGKPDINTIAFAVDAGVEVFQKAVKQNADMLIVHHGLFLKIINPSIIGWQKKRIDILYQNDISLYGAHLPLDRHKIVGNNAQLLRIFGAEPEQLFGSLGKEAVGWQGNLPVAQPREDVVLKLNKKLGIFSTALLFGSSVVQSIAVCSGSGGYGHFFEAQRRGVDMYITGEPIDIYQSAKDSHMNVVFAGHHATETLGVKALAQVLEKQFGVSMVYIDAPTGL